MKTPSAYPNRKAIDCLTNETDVLLPAGFDDPDSGNPSGGIGWRLWAELLAHAAIAILIQVLCNTLY